VDSVIVVSVTVAYCAVSGIISCWLAKRKNRYDIGWLLAGCAMGLPAVIVIALLRPRATSGGSKSAEKSYKQKLISWLESTVPKCPRCGGELWSRFVPGSAGGDPTRGIAWSWKYRHVCLRCENCDCFVEGCGARATVGLQRAFGVGSGKKTAAIRSDTFVCQDHADVITKAEAAQRESSWLPGLVAVCLTVAIPLAGFVLGGVVHEVYSKSESLPGVVVFTSLVATVLMWKFWYPRMCRRRAERCAPGVMAAHSILKKKRKYVDVVTGEHGTVWRFEKL
jgi:hypothetical protein